MLGNGLTIIKQNNAHYIDSREIAEIIDKDHKNLLRDIRGYIEIMENNGKLKVEPSDFFLETTYKSIQNKDMPCYLVSKRGAELISNKLIGEKGILFTALYVQKFNEMEQRERMAAMPKIPQLKECNAAANMIVGALKNANAPADRIAVAVKHLYGLSGIPISLNGMVDKRTYSACEIARICGMLTLKENPHFLAMSAIIAQLNISGEHKTYIPYFYGTKVRISVQYDDYVINQVRRWLAWHDYPCEFRYNGKLYCIMYDE